MRYAADAAGRAGFLTCQPQAAADGTKISVVNVMALLRVLGQRRRRHGHRRGGRGGEHAELPQDRVASAIYSMVGATPMIGQNDDSAEVFTEADASQLVSCEEQRAGPAGLLVGGP